MNEERESYDQSATIYSPDGRMYQVEYAREAVKKGSISMGMIFKDGVLLMVEKRLPSTLAVPESYEKIFKIKDDMAISTSGLIADSRILVDYAREELADYHMRYAEDMPVLELVKRVSNIKRIYTQYGGIRPFGVSFLIGGIDENGICLYETDPSGAYKQYKAGAIGEGKPKVEEIFQKKYKKGNDFKAAINLIFQAYEKALERNIKDILVEIIVITDKEGFKKLSNVDIDKLKKEFKGTKSKKSTKKK